MLTFLLLQYIQLIINTSNKLLLPNTAKYCQYMIGSFEPDPYLWVIFFFIETCIKSTVYVLTQKQTHKKTIYYKSHPRTQKKIHK